MRIEVSLLLFLLLTTCSSTATYTPEETDKLYGFGSNFFGIFGDGGFSLQLNNATNLFDETTRSSIIDIQLGLEFALFLLSNGTVVGVGKNQRAHNQFCFAEPPQEDQFFDMVVLPIPPVKKLASSLKYSSYFLLYNNTLMRCESGKPPQLFKFEKILEPIENLIAGAWFYVAVQTISGRVYFMLHRSTAFDPSRINEFEVNITKLEERSNSKLDKVFLGSTTFFAMKNADLYAIGSNDQGKAGIGQKVRSVTEPTRITITPQWGFTITSIDKIVQSPTVQGFTVILANGAIYSCGDNDRGKLGRSVSADALPTEPEAVDFNNYDKDYNSRNVFHASDYTVVETPAGWFGFGENKHFQIQAAGSAFVERPTRLRHLDAIKGERIKLLSANGEMTIIVTQSNHIYSWGAGKLPQFSPSYIFKPQQIFGSTLSKPIQASLGAQHALFLMQSGEVYGIGGNINGALGNGATSLTSRMALMIRHETVKSPIVQVAAGQDFSAVLTHDGKVFTTGKIHNECVNFERSVLQPLEVESSPTELVYDDAKDPVVQIVAGSYIELVAITASNKIIVMANPCDQMDGRKIVGKIVKVVSIGYMVFLLTDKGDVYGTGYDFIADHHWHKKNIENEPLPVLEGWDVTDMAGNTHFILFLLRNGTVYGYGKTPHGELCKVDTSGDATPLAPLSDVNSLGSKVKFIGAGESHSVFVLEDNRVFMCGDLSFADLGMVFATPKRLVFDESLSFDPVTGNNIEYMVVSGRANYIVLRNQLETNLKKALPWIIVGGSIASAVVVLVLVSIPVLLIARYRKQVNAKKQKIKDSLLLELLQERDSSANSQGSSGESRNSLANSILRDELLFIIQLEEITNLKIIGEGASGSVLKGTWKTQPVAVKLFRLSVLSSIFEEQPESTAAATTATAPNTELQRLSLHQDETSESFLHDFRNEIELLNSLKHPNIVCFYGIIMKQPHIGMVMEYCSKGTLAQFITHNKGKISFESKIQILLHIAKGMNFLHAKNVVHRDLKCENILIDEHNIVKIADFGLARTRATATEEAKKRMTNNVGTSWYMAPEVALGEFYSSSCDVFSFAIIMFELLAETLKPYAEKNPAGIELRVAKNATFRPVLPEHVKLAPHQQFYVEMMMDCWRHEPSSRPTFATVVEHLSSHLEKHNSFRFDSQERTSSFSRSSSSSSTLYYTNS